VFVTVHIPKRPIPATLASQGNANAEARILAVYVKKSRSGASIAADASRKTERLRVRITRLLQIED
jgi:hypothetical protein